MPKKFMKTNRAVLMCLAVVLGSNAISSQAERALATRPKQQPSETSGKNIKPGLPPLPAGVTELKFNEFFVSPIGERGLTLTEKLRGLDGQRVRILGYMARQEAATPGKLLLAPLPVQVCEHDSEFADDLPPSTVHVFVAGCRDQPVPFTPKPLLLTGTLSVGNRDESDGRISIVRLTLEPSPREAMARKPSATEKGAERLVHIRALEN